MILANARIAAGGRVLVPGWLKVEGGRISALGSGTPTGPADQDMSGHWLVPGFVDMHVHGAAGFSFDEASGTAVDAVTGHHLAHGTTTMLASLVSAPVDVLEDRLRALAPYVANGTLAGVHLEGPFLSARHCGAHDPRALRAPDRTAIAALLDAAPGSLRLMTLAPELPEAVSAIEQITAAGVVAAIGHTGADYETTLAAIAAGASVATHLYNGMPPILGRAPGAGRRASRSRIGDHRAHRGRRPSAPCHSAPHRGRGDGPPRIDHGRYGRDGQSGR
ncbi:amidohydrolase family protein [Actinospica sp. MGRD01-02]|uniref:Amidohydrolase family protein n=1 Tax=Actinospica acidithermotolerans TaxID=2828514 RepID=A0A941E643_9ACTN|nr:amidohydrolase family protein [Actinospica acidithermotolerans]MBR7825137.1 amidohydrolase family protein [Actinospica acidithermotolerans]